VILQGAKTPDVKCKGRYDPAHGDSGRKLSQDQGGPVAGAEDARPPGFPSIEELKELNREIHEDAGFPEHFKLDQRSPLDSCLAQAQAAYVATPDGVIQTAAFLAHGIARAQAFRDGNRRTAYVATRTFLYGAGYGYLTSTDGVSDHTLARYLNQVVEPGKGDPPTPKKFATLFRRRLGNRKPPSRNPESQYS
jgi:prophage maintenance system killer protein